MSLISNKFAKEDISEKVKWFLKLSPTQRHNIAASVQSFFGGQRKGHYKNEGLFKTIQVIKQK